MEEEIISIGAEQNVIFNRLRLFIDYYLLRNQTDRQQLTDHVSAEISRYAQVCGPNIRPMSVKRRLTADELNNKFIANNSTADDKQKLPSPQDDDSQVISLDDMDDMSMTMSDDPNDDYSWKVESEVMEVLLSPDDIPAAIESNNQQPQQTYSQLNNKAQQKQESLLKPKAERVSLTKEERVATTKVTKENARKPSPPAEAINLSRLRLKQALCKAKDANKPVEAVRVKSASPDTVKFVPTESKPITILSSSSSSSSSSSEDFFEAIDWSNENAAPPALSQEPFLRYFGLYSHTYSEYLTKKRSVRKRRMCTSTEHRDFHYGRLDLFEKQYANKRNKRQFLYSPPATRAKKQRRAASDAELQSNAVAENGGTGRGIKSNASSSSSLSSTTATTTNAKVCVKCFKRSKFPFACHPFGPLTNRFFSSLADNLLECRICMGKYHAACHIGLASSSSLFDICPCCWRQQSRRQLQQNPTNGQRKTAFHTYGRRPMIIKIN